jgi:hypothetical protein
MFEGRQLKRYLEKARSVASSRVIADFNRDCVNAATKSECNAIPNCKYSVWNNECFPTALTERIEGNRVYNGAFINDMVHMLQRDRKKSGKSFETRRAELFKPSKKMLARLAGATSVAAVAGHSAASAVSALMMTSTPVLVAMFGGLAVLGLALKYGLKMAGISSSFSMYALMGTLRKGGTFTMFTPLATLIGAQVAGVLVAKTADGLATGVSKAIGMAMDKVFKNKKVRAVRSAYQRELKARKAELQEVLRDDDLTRYAKARRVKKAQDAVDAAEKKLNGNIAMAAIQAAVYVIVVLTASLVAKSTLGVSTMGILIQIAMAIVYRLLKHFVGPRKVTDLAAEFIKASTITALFAAVTSPITSFF